MHSVAAYFILFFSSFCRRWNNPTSLRTFVDDAPRAPTNHNRSHRTVEIPRASQKRMCPALRDRTRRMCGMPPVDRDREAQRARTRRTVCNCRTTCEGCVPAGDHAKRITTRTYNRRYREFVDASHAHPRCSTAYHPPRRTKSRRIASHRARREEVAEGRHREDGVVRTEQGVEDRQGSGVIKGVYHRVDHAQSSPPNRVHHEHVQAALR